MIIEKTDYGVVIRMTTKEYVNLKVVVTAHAKWSHTAKDIASKMPVPDEIETSSSSSCGTIKLSDAKDMALDFALKIIDDMKDVTPKQIDKWFEEKFNKS